MPVTTSFRTDNQLPSPKVLELDGSAVAKTKLQINDLVNQVKIASQSGEDSDEFYSLLLTNVVAAMGARGAAIWRYEASESAKGDDSWTVVASEKLPPIFTDAESDPIASLDIAEALLEQIESDFDASSFHDSLESSSSSCADEKTFSKAGITHLKLLRKVSLERQPILVPPGRKNRTPTSAPDGSPTSFGFKEQSYVPENPTTDYLIYAPVSLDKLFGTYWLQVIQPPSGGIATQRGFLRFVAQIADLIADFLKTKRLRDIQEEQRLFQATEMIVQLARNESTQSVKLSALVEALRDVGQAEQVFLLHRESSLSKWTPLAISGVKQFDRYSDGIRLVHEVATSLSNKSNFNLPAIVQCKDRRDPTSQMTVGSPLDNGKQEPNNSQSIEHFASIYNAARIAWIPVLQATGDAATGVGCLVYWSWNAGKPSDRKIEKFTGFQQKLGSIALSIISPNEINPRRFGNPFKRSINQSSLLFYLKRSRLFQSVLVILATVGAGFVPVNISWISPAVVRPASLEYHYAASDSRVIHAFVDYDEHVVKGQPLLQLKDEHLESKLFDAEISYNQSKEKIVDLQSRILRGDQLTQELKTEIEGELETLRAMLPVQRLRFETLSQQKKSLTLCAAEDGIVKTWNAKQLLTDRPVRAGQLLIQVQPTNSTWVAEARLPQRYAGEFIDYARGNSINAECRIASDPSQPFTAVYQSKQSPAFVSPSEGDRDGGHVRIQFSIATDSLELLNNIRAGANATIKINRGRGPIAKMLFGDAWQSIVTRIRLWFL